MSFDQSAYQEAVQATIRALAAFSDADVVINDYTILDQPMTSAPYVIIANAITANVTESMGNVTAGTLQIPFTIYQPFGDGWEEAGNTLRDLADAVVNGFNGDDWSANGMGGVTIQYVRLEAEIQLYEPSITDESLSDPVYLARPVVLEMELF